MDGGATASYVYDALGRRVAATVGGVSYNYILDQAGRWVAKASPSGDTVYADEIYAGGRHLATYANNTTYFHHADWLGTERVRTDIYGAAVESCTSLPFGESLNCSGPDVSTMHFTGQEHDAESGLDHFWFRQYTSTEGRWTTPDPAGLAAVDPSNPQSWNRYGYVGSDPINYVDPLGLDNLKLQAEPTNWNCMMNYVLSPCSMVSSAVSAGGAYQCDGPCGAGLKAEQGPGGSTVLKQYTWIAGYVVPYNYDSATGYVLLSKELGHWGWQTVRTGSGSQLPGGDVPVGMDIFRNSPQCPNCGDTWRNASGAVDTAAVATMVVAAPVVIASAAPTVAAAYSIAYDQAFNLAAYGWATAETLGLKPTQRLLSATWRFGSPGPLGTLWRTGTWAYKQCQIYSGC